MKRIYELRLNSFLLIISFWVFLTAGAKADPVNKSSFAPWLGELTAKKVIAASSPDNNFKVLREFYRSATRSIHISVYQLDNIFISDVLEDALDRGVEVTLLLEGAPIPKIPTAELYIAKRLVAKGSGAKIYFYDIAQGRNSRAFKYFHNKYGIVDGRKVIVGSANYGNSGHPINSTAGNREWEVVIEDRDVAALFEQAFEHDLSLENAWTPYGNSPRFTLNDSSFAPDRSESPGDYDFEIEPAQDSNVRVQSVFAPDNSLSQSGAILGTLAGAQESVLVQQLNFETYWGDKTYNPDPESSPMMDMILALARAGRTIRILLNDDFVFRDQEFYYSIAPSITGPFNSLVATKPKRDNRATIQYLQKIARQEGRDLSARLLNYRRCGVGVLHNKGMIVDGKTTLVSSLNWGESALKFNREAGVILQSSVIADYYTEIFGHDWKCSR